MCKVFKEMSTETLEKTYDTLPEQKWESRDKTSVFVSHLSPQEHVGRKCMVKCLLDWLETDAS